MNSLSVSLVKICFYSKEDFVMKKKIALFLSAVMTVSALCFGTAVSAEEYTKVTLKVEGKEVETDQPAVIVDSRTMVPVRVVAEALGCKVDWDADTKTVSFEQASLKATMVIGEKVLNVTKGGATLPVSIDAPAVIINSRTMVPIRFLSENFGYGVDWDADTKTVNVTASKDDVESGAAVDADTQYTGMADRELRDNAEDLDALIGKLNDVEGMSKEQVDVLAKNSDTVAKVFAILDMGKYTQDEIAAAEKAIEEAGEALNKLADELGVKADEEEPAEEKALTADDIKAKFEEVDALVGKVNDAKPALSEDEQKAYDEHCDKTATVGSVLGTTDMDDADEFKAADEALTAAEDYVKSIAEKYDIKL